MDGYPVSYLDPGHMPADLCNGPSDLVAGCQRSGRNLADARSVVGIRVAYAGSCHIHPDVMGAQMNGLNIDVLQRFSYFDEADRFHNVKGRASPNSDSGGTA